MAMIALALPLESAMSHQAIWLGWSMTPGT